MNTTTRFKLVTPKGLVDAQGEVLKVKIAEQPVTFVIHPAGSDRALSHLPSGRRIGTLDAMRISHLRQYRRISDKTAAKLLINKLSLQHSEERLLEALTAHRVINRCGE